jgi:tetratricopeptide (TPR) repeat protein
MLSFLGPFLLLGLALLVGILAHQVYFISLPRRAIRKYQRADPIRLQRYLARVVATPSLLGPAQKLTARSALMQIAQADGRYSEAAAHGREILEHLPKAPHVTGFTASEARIRYRLADCLEALGQLDEAATERQLAEGCIDRVDDDRSMQILRAKSLQRQYRHDDARQAFEAALALTPDSNIKGRIQCLSELILAYYLAGRPDESLGAAAQIIALGAKGTPLREAHRLAGMISGELGEFDVAEDHLRRAYDLALAEENRGMRGQILAALADLQHKQGKLDEAYETAEGAKNLDPKAIRLAVAVQSAILSIQGRSEEALVTLQHHNENPEFSIPLNERRARAMIALIRARINAEAGKENDAHVAILEASAELGHDAKLGVQCDAVLSWITALQGLARDSRQLADEIEARLPEFDQDQSTRRAILFDLGMAAWARGDFEEGVNCWSRYLEEHPSPVYQPSAFYFRGECFQALGDLAGAKADYDAALALGIGTHHTRLARGRREAISED